MLLTSQSKAGDRKEVKRDLGPEDPLWSVASGLSWKRPVILGMA